MGSEKLYEKDLLKLFLNHKKCFVKFGKANDYILNKLLKICKLQLVHKFNNFLYKCPGHINVCKIFLANLQCQINLFFTYHKLN